jgi:hypothetical protein
MNTKSSFVRDQLRELFASYVTRQSNGNQGTGKVCGWFLAVMVLTLLTSGLAMAQTDPFIGTWKMNSAKSNFGDGPARKSETRIVISTPTGMKIDVDRTNSDGSNQQFEYTANLDGKSYPITGNGPFGADAISVNLTSPNTLSAKLTRGGKLVAKATLVVSKDGKTLTITGEGTDEKGKKSKSAVVYDKQ